MHVGREKERESESECAAAVVFYLL